MYFSRIDLVNVMNKLSVFITSALLLCLFVCGCSKDKSAAVSEDNVASNDSSASQKITIPQFARPADAFDFEKATTDQGDNGVVIKYDDKGRIKDCRYTTESNMDCHAIYTYNDTYAHIFTFGGNALVDDIIIHCEYSEGTDCIIINGYYFTNTKSNEK